MGGNSGNNKMTITQVAKKVGVATKTIMRWEHSGKVNLPRRDWRGWRVYYKEDLEKLREFHESLYYLDETV